MGLTKLEIIHELAEFLREHVAPNVKLKRSMDGEDSAYMVDWVHPKIYEAALPMVGELPADGVRQSAPSIVVAPTETIDGPTFSQGFHLLFCVWNPGNREDIDDDGVAHGIRVSAQGWRDLILLQEKTVRALREAQCPIGMKLELPVRHSIYNRTKDTPDYYPYWWGWMQFSLTRPDIKAPRTSPGGFSL